MCASELCCGSGALGVCVCVCVCAVELRVRVLKEAEGEEGGRRRGADALFRNFKTAAHGAPGGPLALLTPPPHDSPPSSLRTGSRPSSRPATGPPWSPPPAA